MGRRASLLKLSLFTSLHLDLEPQDAHLLKRGGYWPTLFVLLSSHVISI